MASPNFKLFIQIDNSNFSFVVGEKDDYGNFKLNYNFELPISGIEDSRISDLEQVFNIFKENIYLIEQKINFTFREIILILDNFNYIQITYFMTWMNT